MVSTERRSGGAEIGYRNWPADNRHLAAIL